MIETRVPASPETTAFQAQLRLSEGARGLLRCPACHTTLHDARAVLTCTSASCGLAFPIVDGVPVLINEANSLFSITDIVAQRNAPIQPRPRLFRAARQLMPSLSMSLNSRHNFEQFAAQLLEQTPRPRVLVIGGSSVGKGMGWLTSFPDIELIESDVFLSSRTSIVCDGHDLPFESGSLDGVIVQAVLEHVVDPYRCVDELWRVLKPVGLVYAETPFMQQVHLGCYDFTRFTPLGHRRLFRRFEEIARGASGGPGTVLAWSYYYFLLGFASSRRGKIMATAIARLTGFWLKYVDYLFVDTPGAQDGAKGSYFLGRKSQVTLADRDLIKLYNGLM